jgi:hypothetical protein
MTRAGFAAVFVVALGLMAPPAAHAGLGSLVRLVAGAGKVATKAAPVASKGALGLKGAGKLGALVAAERVFAHVADDAARVPVFVTRSDDGFRVVMAGGDEVAHDASSLKTFTADLDAMAGASDEAGVDLYVDRSALGDLAGLSLTENTRIFLANTDGPSLPLRTLGDGGVEAAAAPGLWLRTDRIAFDLAVEVAQQAVSVSEVLAPAGCGGVDPKAAIDAAAEGDLLVVLDDVDPADREAWLAYASAHGVDLVVLGIAEVCAGDALSPTAAATAERAARATTVAEVWTSAGVFDLGAVAHALEDEALRLRGAAISAVHRGASEPAAAAATDVDSIEPPLALLAWATVAGLVIGVAWVWGRPKKPA